MKICTKCNTGLPEGWTFPCCPYCGAQLPQETTEKQSATLQMGDANAISGGVHIDSHNVTTNNITNIERNKTTEELHQERVVKFKMLCQQVYADGRVDLNEARQMENLRMELGLSVEEAEHIREEVRNLRTSHSGKTLNPIARMALSQVTVHAKNCNTNRLQASMPRLEVLAEKYTDDEVQFYYHMILAAIQPEDCIERYENRKFDNYWLAFWTYMAYINTGQVGEAEAVLDSLSVFDQYPYGNITLLATASSLYQYWDSPEMSDLLEQANMFFEQGCEDHSDLLDRFTQVLMMLLDVDDKDAIEEFRKEFAFYFTYLFDEVIKRKQKACVQRMLPRIPKIAPLPH